MIWKSDVVVQVILQKTLSEPVMLVVKTVKLAAVILNMTESVLSKLGGSAEN